MARLERPSNTEGSEHWLRVMVNDYPIILNMAIFKAFGWNSSQINWRSPLKDDNYAEYSDKTFLDRLDARDLKMKLQDFWPLFGPCWDGLANTSEGKLILVEAKAYIDEVVDYQSRASARTLPKIKSSLEEAKNKFNTTECACWHSPLYQMANRLAHIYYLAELNRKDAYLAFIYFANASDVRALASPEEWQGAVRLAYKCLGLKNSQLSKRVTAIIVDLKKLNSNQVAGKTSLNCVKSSITYMHGVSHVWKAV